MMDNNLFFMQRYLGSDDEDSVDSSGNNKEAENLSALEDKHNEPKQKKQRLSEAADKKIQNNSITIAEENTKSLNKNNLESSEILNPKEEIIQSTKKKSKKLAKKVSDDQNLLEENNNSKTDAILNPQNEVINDTGAFCTIGQIKDRNIEKIKPILPKWLSDPTIIEIDLKKDKIPISDVPYLDNASKKTLQDAGISFLFPVQSAVIPWLLQNNERCLSTRPSDLCVSAPTGSGKTLAFVLPIVQSLKSRTVTAVRALIVLPVGELAIQVYKVFEMFVRGTDLKVVLLTGQKSFAAEQNALVKQGIRRTLSLVDIIVTTPGRILDHISRTEGFSLKHLRFLVIDEADRMMDDIQKGWLKQIENAVHRNCPSHDCLCFSTGGERMSFVPSTACHFGHINEPLQKLLYSATLSHDPEKLHTLSLYKPKLFTTEAKSEGWIGKCSIPENLTLYSTICKSDTKPLVLCHFIKKNQFKKVLCFMDSIERAQRLHFILEDMGILRVREISSIIRPVQRKIILEQFSAGKLDVLVCSDLVARGIDIEGVDCVISYDVPLYIKRYVHRIGRTARAGKKGTALTLVTEVESSPFTKMLKSAGMPVPKCIDVTNQDLEIYVESFKNALTIADSKIKKLKANTKNHSKGNKKENIQKKSQLSKSSKNSTNLEISM